MSNEISNAERAIEDAKENETPRALKDAQRKVKERVEGQKPGAGVERVEQAPNRGGDS